MLANSANKRSAVASLLRIVAARQLPALPDSFVTEELTLLAPNQATPGHSCQQSQFCNLAAFQGGPQPWSSLRTFSSRAKSEPESKGNARQHGQQASEKQSPACQDTELGGERGKGQDKANNLEGVTYKQLKREAERKKRAADPFEASLAGRRILAAALRRFEGSAEIKDQALAIYVSAKAFPRLVGGFGKFLMDSLTEPLHAFMLEATKQRRTDLMFRLFAEYTVDQHSDELQAYREAVRSMDLRRPYLWYPVARSLKRKFIYHAGPTNSGKTFTALEAMRGAPSGVYCGPLRLLAMEVYDACNAAGTFCNLMTGQEKKLVPGATHTSCTIEMTNMFRRVDVAVVDEVQLLGDAARGWAWTRALQGLPANEIHVCGDGSAIPLVRKLAAAMGEAIEVREYQRFTPVEVEEGGLVNGFQDVQPGDCIVAFSRKAIFEIKSFIESTTGLRTCVVYGALPPETRRTQARLFNEEGNEYSVMVASDAVGMGLNLNVRRIIFHSLIKSEGHAGRRQITVSEIKQIAGRAGRRNSQFPVGFATCLDPADVPVLREAMAAPMSDLSTPAAGLFPEFEHLEAYASKSLQQDFESILRQFAADAQLDGTYFFCRQDSMAAAARLLARVEGLSLQERYSFCNAPVSLREPRHAAALLHFATRYAAQQPVHLEVRPPDRRPATPDELHHMENLHQVVAMWLWLAQRFDPATFPGRDAAEALSADLITQMDEALMRMYANPSKEDEALGRRRHRKTSDKVKNLRQSYIENLEWVAQQHLTEKTDERVRQMLEAKQRAHKSRQKQGIMVVQPPAQGPRKYAHARA